MSPCLGLDTNMSATSTSRASPACNPHGGARPHPCTSSKIHSLRCKPAGPISTPNTGASRQSRLEQSEGIDNSPNYFNLKLDSVGSGQSSAAGNQFRNNFSPPSSTIRSTAAISPRIVPVDQNPKFAEFRRQSDLLSNQNGPLAFQLSPISNKEGSVSSPQPRSISSSIASCTQTGNPAVVSKAVDKQSPRSPKRTLSSPFTNITDLPRRNSPAEFAERESPSTINRMKLAKFARDSYPPVDSHLASAVANMQSGRAATMPLKLGGSAAPTTCSAPMFISSSQFATLLLSHEDEILLLDLRVNTQYIRARIRGALNLCIPTTLFKRPMYNTAKLAESFAKSPAQRQKFEKWPSYQYIIAYDGNCSKERDATICMNMLKKFSAEGWNRSSYIIRGGFFEFSKQFPKIVEHGAAENAGSASASACGQAPSHSLAPVIGGCPIPVGQGAANPFFGNIRQNMDLISGVGQLAVKNPASLGIDQTEKLPDWLKEAIDVADNGQLVAKKFLAIEKQEQKRMQEALSSKDIPDAQTCPSIRVQIAGIEKGAKNRYNNIWPFEHSRVKLEGVPDGGCDYINASHVKAEWSNKRFIATQGPVPTTFKQDIRTIVMLTAETEGGQVKAHNYWKERHFGFLHLTFLSEHRASLEPDKIHRRKEKLDNRPQTGAELSGDRKAGTSDLYHSSEEPYVTVRRFSLTNDQAPFERMREITHIQHSHWPDFGAPAHPAHLLGLVEQCENVVRFQESGSSYRGDHDKSRPIVVHCSAGCGRTGTFCSVWSVIDMLSQQKLYRTKRERQPDVMEMDVAHSSSESSRVSDGETSGTSSLPADKDNWLERDDIDLVEKTVQEFRLQRISMVQSLRQYVLCYETVSEYLAGQKASG